MRGDQSTRAWCIGNHSMGGGAPDNLEEFTYLEENTWQMGGDRGRQGDETCSKGKFCLLHCLSRASPPGVTACQHILPCAAYPVFHTDIEK